LRDSPVAIAGSSGLARSPIRVAVGLSIALHVLLLVIPLKAKLEGAASNAAMVQGPLNVQLGSPSPPAPVIEAKPESKPERAARPRREIQPPPRPLTVPHSPDAIKLPPPPVQEPEPMPAPKPEPQFDMAALIQANRARRRAAELAELRGSGAGGAMGSDEAATANLNRNLQSLRSSDGTGGVFRILRMGARTGEFAFNGWRRERGRQWREVIEVDAGPGGNLERAIVRRMIVLIREHYTGDFNWESPRIGRVVVLSAAPENNEELEDYLMREFFGTPVVKRGQ
jgi:hypothetical protein